VTEIPDVKVGDTAVLFGRDGDEEISAHEVGRWAGTIPYEVLTSIGSRVAKVYLEKRKGTRKREFSRERVQVLRVN